MIGFEVYPKTAEEIKLEGLTGYPSWYRRVTNEFRQRHPNWSIVRIRTADICVGTAHQALVEKTVKFEDLFQEAALIEYEF